MKVYPNSTTIRPELNLRQGIKSSLPEIKALIALTYVLYETNKESSSIIYNQEINQIGATKIKEVVIDAIQRFFSKQLDTKSKTSLIDEINQNPLNKAQLEALQVSLQLFLKFGIIDFVGDFPATYERTGGKRYEKEISFSTNLDLFRLILTNSEKQISESVKDILWNWIVGKEDFIEDVTTVLRIQQFLTILTEESQFKIRKANGEELFFQQEGIYKVLVEGNTAFEKDAHEPVGPFRIFKSFITKGLHPYIKETSNGFESKIPFDELEIYLNKVSITLDLIPKRTLLIQEQSVEIDSTVNKPPFKKITPLQKIYFGSPGTGKSTELKRFVKDNNLEIIRTTFHPDTDYQSFVGGYKPIMQEDKIIYRFVPQAFTKAYVKAHQNPEIGYLLAIEEINRGNCASIFGDLFQCLDRDKYGYSEYEIESEADLAAYLISEGLPTEIKLPPNLLIYATMNTSDQSLFPMDAAFKRRWEWQYVPIKFDENSAKTSIIFDDSTSYNWQNFVETINPKIEEITKSEDKKIGVYFITPSNGTEISVEQFKNKVMFYLWSEVCKDERDSPENFFQYLDNEGVPQVFSFNDLFEDKGNEILKGFMKFLALS